MNDTFATIIVVLSSIAIGGLIGFIASTLFNPTLYVVTLCYQKVEPDFTITSMRTEKLSAKDDNDALLKAARKINREEPDLGNLEGSIVIKI